MSMVTPSIATVSPSYVLPGVLNQISMASGWRHILGGGAPQVRIGSNDLYVYAKYLRVKTQVKASQSGGNELPSSSITTGMISTPTYRFKSRAQWGMFDTDAASDWGYALPEAMRLANRQGFFQAQRNAMIYGINPANGEGVLNSGAAQQNLGSDSHSATTYTTWDAGELALRMLSIIATIQASMMQVGTPMKITVLAPQRFITQISLRSVVQLTQFQRIGAGSSSPAAMVQDLAQRIEDSVIFAADDTLIGQGAGGTDAILFVAPELNVPDDGGTNEFARFAPNTLANTIMLQDMAAPMEVSGPVGDSDILTLYTMRTTSGWVLRPESTTILSAAYS